MENLLYITIFACSIKNLLCYMNCITNTTVISQLCSLSKIPTFLEHSLNQASKEINTEALHQNRKRFKYKDPNAKNRHKIVKRQSNDTETALENIKHKLNRGRNNIFMSIEDNTPIVFINLNNAKNKSVKFINQPYNRKGTRYDNASLETTTFTEKNELKKQKTHRNSSPNKRRIPRKITIMSREYMNLKTTDKLNYDIVIKDKIKPWKRFKGSLQLKSESYENKNKRYHSKKVQNDMIEEKRHKHKSKDGKKGMETVRKTLLGMLLKKMKSKENSNSITETNNGVTMLLRNSRSNDEKKLQTVEPRTLAEKSLRRFKTISVKHSLKHNNKMDEKEELISGVTMLSQNSYQDKNKRPQEIDQLSHIKKTLRRYKIVSNKHSFEDKANDKDNLETRRPRQHFFSDQPAIVYRNDQESSVTEKSANTLRLKVNSKSLKKQKTTHFVTPETNTNIDPEKIKSEVNVNKTPNKTIKDKISSHEIQNATIDKPINKPRQEKIYVKAETKEDINKTVNKITKVKESSGETELADIDKTSNEEKINLKSAKKEKLTPKSTTAEQSNNLDKTEPEINLKNMLNKFTENNLLDNLTNIIMDKMLEKRNLKHESVERIEIFLGSDDKVDSATEKRALAERFFNEPKKKHSGTKRRIYYLK